MILRSLVYTSRSLLPKADAIPAVDDIVAVAQDRNARDQITGALLFGANRFAQALEGPVAAVDALMAAIARDPRHGDIVVLADATATSRRFPEWSLAYAGPSLFVARTIALPTFEAEDGSALGIEELIALMREFARNPMARAPLHRSPSPAEVHRSLSTHRSRPHARHPE